MDKCNCYRAEPNSQYKWIKGRCTGTREFDVCSCGGDPAKCDFYPEVRRKAYEENFKQQNLQWNVLYYNCNAQRIEPYNIFKHSSFAGDVKKLLKEDLTVEDFASKLKRILMYYFWSKCEHEVIIQAWPPSHSDVEKKVDIYDQVLLNWDVFVNYVLQKGKVK